MKKFRWAGAFAMLLSVISSGVMADLSVAELDLSVPENRAKKVEWFYSGWSNIVDLMYKCYSPVQLDMLTPLLNYLIEHDAVVSLDELVDLCLHNEKGQHGSNITKLADDDCKDKSLMIEKWDMKSKTQQNLKEIYPELEPFCGLLFDNVLAEQNLAAKNWVSAKIQYKMPGTYVVKHSDGVYRVTNVVLADGYKKNGQISKDVNTAYVNTGIYEIQEDGSVLDLGWHTYTNDMFLNTMATNDVRGIFSNSYICVNSDVSHDIDKMFNSMRGSDYYAVTSGFNLLPKKKYDTKVALADLCKIDGQPGNASHTNGVVLRGKVANLEWLGHYLYGMIRNEIALVSPEKADKIRAELQSLTNNVDGDENLPHQMAADLGIEYRQSVEIDRRFDKTEFETPEEAIKAVKEIVVRKWAKYGAKNENVTCCNNCNMTFSVGAHPSVLPGQVIYEIRDSNDVVWCNYDNKQIDFVIDDVADGVFTTCYSTCL